MKQYDVAIAGSGLAALICGYILSKEGLSVYILEKNAQIGGCLQVFNRDGCTFDTGVHYIGGLDTGQVTHRLFNYFDLLDNIGLQRMNEDGFDIINFMDKEYKIAMGYDNFENTLNSYFPKERNAIHQYIKRQQNVCANIDLYNIREVNEEAMMQLDMESENAFDFFAKITSDKTLQNVFAWSNPLYAGMPDRTSMQIHAPITQSFINGAYRVVDGSATIAKHLAESIIKNGGSIRTKTEVKHIHCKVDNVEYFELADGEKIVAKDYISNIHPSITLDMLNECIIRKISRTRIRELENTISVFSIYAVLKPDTFPYLNYNYYGYQGDNIWSTSTYSKEKWPNNFVLYTPASRSNSKFAESVTIIAYMKYEELKEWENTLYERRGNSYKEFKQLKAEQLLNRVATCFPYLKNSIKSIYTSSPLTYRDYFNYKEGAIYGIQRNCNEAARYYISPKTKLNNLYLTGQNINKHGVLGVSLGALLTCGKMIGLNYLLKKINSSN